MAGFRIIRRQTAFSNAPVGKQKKRPRDNDAKHLEWIRRLPCVITGTFPVDAAHVRYEDRAYGKRETGKGEKPDDKWVVPLSRQKHDEQHSMNERIFWARHGVDPLRIALALYACTGDDEQAHVIIREAHAAVRSFQPKEAEALAKETVDRPPVDNGDNGHD
jgi:hypothetical protein